MAKIEPDSRTPRRFTIIMSSTNATSILTMVKVDDKVGKSVASACTPAATLTETVRT